MIIYSNNKRHHAIKIILFIFLALLLGGCARTVTPTVTGNQITFAINFRGEVNSSVNKYYILLGTQPPQLPYSNYYFFAPGENYESSLLQGTLASYYQNYFSTWSDYILLQSQTFNINNGSFGAAASGQHFSFQPLLLSYRSTPTTTEEAQKITLTFYFNRLSTVPALLYFNFACVDSFGYLQDKLDDDNGISTAPDTMTGVITDAVSDAADSSLDIISWSAIVQ